MRNARFFASLKMTLYGQSRFCNGLVWRPGNILPKSTPVIPPPLVGGWGEGARGPDPGSTGFQPVGTPLRQKTFF